MRILTKERLAALLDNRSVRLDAEGDTLSTTLRAIRILADTRMPDDELLHRSIQRWGVNVAVTSARNFDRKIERLPSDADKSALRQSAFPTVNPLQDDRVRRQVHAMLRENVELINGVDSGTNVMVRNTITRAIRENWGVDRLHKNLDRRFNTPDGPVYTKARVQTIVRDQTLKYHAAIQREQFAEAGLDSYIWRTVGDERVRATHRDNNGKVFKWSDPPLTGHPGAAINCRCSPEIVLGDVDGPFIVETDTEP